jgi:glutathione peroxidase-family protein
MKHGVFAVLFVAGGLLTPALADDYENLDKLIATLPKDAAAVLNRHLECSHFAGEEPSSKARAQEIARATVRAKCDFVDRDEAELLKRYANDPKVAKAIHDAKALDDEP